VTDGIFDDGLEKETRYKTIKRAWIDLDLHPQAICKAHLFDGEVVVDQLKLLSDWDLLRSGALKRALEDCVEMGEYLDSLLLAAELHKGCDRVERIEKEVRFELCLERT
jgi:hypothetical protein